VSGLSFDLDGETFTFRPHLRRSLSLAEAARKAGRSEMVTSC
jgi:hypothetical protein